MTIGERVRHWRTVRHWSQGELAARAGLSVSEISRLEAGSVQAGLKALMGLSTAFECCIDTLVYGPRTSDERAA